MPTLWAHRLYFNVSSTVVPPTLAPSKGGYPLWQASGFAVGSLFGGLQRYWEDLTAWIVSVYRRFRPAPPPPLPREPILLHAHALTQHPAYPHAVAAVAKTATTLSFNRPEAWQGLSRQMKSSPGRAENVYRHLLACQLTRETAGSTLTNPDCNLLVELAYHDWALRNR